MTPLQRNTDALERVLDDLPQRHPQVRVYDSGPPTKTGDVDSEQPVTQRPGSLGNSSLGLVG